MRFRPLGIGDIIDGAFKLFRADWREILLAVGVVVIPAQILVAALQVGVVDNIAGLEDSTFDADVAVSLVQGVGSFLVITLLTSLLLIVARAVVLRISGARLFGSQERPRAALTSGLRLFGRLLASSVLKFLASMAVFAPALVLIGLSIATGDEVYGIVGGVIFLPALGVAVWLYVSWALTEAVIVMEDGGAVAAFGRSRRLVAGRWWPTLGVLLLTGIVVMVVGGIIGGVPQQVGGFLLFTQPAVAAVLLAIGGILASLVTEPLGTLVALLLWTDLRIRKEGLDLQVAEQSETGGAATGAGGWAPSGQAQPPAQDPQGWQGGQGWGSPG